MSSHARSFAPLLLLCALSAAALNLYALLDPTGVYASYRDAQGASAPPVAAMAAALSDGVYPWSRPAPDVSAPDGGEDLPPLPSGEDAAADAQPDIPPEPVSPFTSVDTGYFDDALFIGDSHTDGFKDYAGLSNASYLCHNGLTVWSAEEKAVFEAPGGGRQTLAEALSGRQYGKIYMMLGINELGTGTAESWATQYAVLLDEVCALQPDAIVFLQAIFHTTQEKSDTTFFKNETIDARNAELQKLADNESIFYIDCNPVFDDETGVLRADYSGDGVHVKAAYYVLWRDYLFDFGVVRDGGIAWEESSATADAPAVPAA